MPRELTTSDVARRNGIDRRTAYRWLKALHEQYGPSVVARRGRRGVFVTTEEAFTKVAPLAAVAIHDRRLSALEERLADLEKRLDHHVAEHIALRRRLLERT